MYIRDLKTRICDGLTGKNVPVSGLTDVGCIHFYGLVNKSTIMLNTRLNYSCYLTTVWLVYLLNLLVVVHVFLNSGCSLVTVHWYFFSPRKFLRYCLSDGRVKPACTCSLPAASLRHLVYMVKLYSVVACMSPVDYMFSVRSSRLVFSSR